MIAILTYPRSGSKFTAKLLRYNGLDVGHEKVFNDGVVSWRHAVSPKFEEIQLPFNTLHQVRYPRASISSAATAMRASLKFMVRAINIAGYFNGGDIIDEYKYRLENKKFDQTYKKKLALELYPIWDSIIKDKKPIWGYKIETLNDPKIWDKFCNLTNLNKGKWIDVGAKYRHSRVNIYEKILTWEELESLNYNATQEVRKLTKEYGYEDY